MITAAMYEQLLYCNAEAGLHYSRFRHYDPDIGRFVTQDPIGLAGEINNYQYAPNPAGWIDPFWLVDINLFSTGENIHGYAEKTPKKNNVFQVGAHGTLHS